MQLLLEVFLLSALLPTTLSSSLRRGHKQPDYQRTQIFIRYTSLPGENVFIRGGISSHVRPDCVEDAEEDPCAIGIRHRIRPTDTGSSYYQWSEGDDHLDWYGPEDGQGDFGQVQAGGTPMMWTTWESPGPSDPVVEEDGHGYTAYNRFGEHFWFVDLDMDCSATEGGWFEFKTYVIPLTGWEDHINQYSKCAGETGITKPYTTLNHLGLCGRMNTFFFEEDECNVFDIPQDPEALPADGCGVRKMFDADKTTVTSGVLNPAPQTVGGESPAPQIVGGEAATMGRWPWQGVLQYSNTIGGCAGILVDSNWALTAAHCVTGTNPAILKVRFGEQNLVITQGNEQAIQVSLITIHYKYGNPDPGDPYNDNDVALLRLATPVDLTSYVVNLACLPFGYGLDDFVGDVCWATGFGDTKNTGDRYRHNEIDVDVLSHEDCVEHWGQASVTERQVCMGAPGKSACGGDSGGPLVCWKTNKFVLVGVTSWGTSNCDGLSVYSRVTAFLDWIEDVTGISPTSCSY